MAYFRSDTPPESNKDRRSVSMMRSLLVVASLVALCEASAPANGRLLVAKSAFEWVEDPHAAERCEGDPKCTNHVKYGFNVAPVNVSRDEDVVFQRAERPSGLSAVMSLETYTQPGCVMSGCRTTRFLGVLPQEDCYNVQVKKQATEPDGKTARIDFGGIYYEHLPEGELYVKFERRNYLTDEDSCSYEVRGGFKRWF